MLGLDFCQILGPVRYQIILLDQFYPNGSAFEQTVTTSPPNSAVWDCIHT